ncbi:MAG: helix-turn-helix transcriptional regulator [Woeseiaceae bacterium]|nr:helix-turn-helix transcriptional regulator [Woeseiaceae bacterium]
MEKVFKALADATRRRLLDRLLETPGLTLSELVAGLGMTRQSATRHLAVLEDAGLLVTVWRGREKRHYVNPVPITDIGDRWIDKFADAEQDATDALNKALDD